MTARTKYDRSTSLYLAKLRQIHPQKSTYKVKHLACRGLCLQALPVLLSVAPFAALPVLFSVALPVALSTALPRGCSAGLPGGGLVALSRGLPVTALKRMMR